MYSCYKLTENSRDRLLSTFRTKFDRVIAHHVTLKFGVPVGESVPEAPEACNVVGYAANDKIECLVVEVDGNTRRPDGSTFHITLSLDSTKAKPADSNALLRELGWKPLNSPIGIDVKPSIER